MGSKSEGLAQSSVEYGGAPELDGRQDAFMNSVISFMYKYKLKEDKLSRRPLQSKQGKQIYQAYVTSQTSLSANAPACVAGWGSEEPAGCLSRTAHPPASGTVPDLGG